MARPLRLEYSGALYHITARGNERRKIYRGKEDYDLFLEVLARVVKQMDWLCHAYCLMPNHYHLLLETKEPNLSEGMRQLNGIYTQRFNHRHKRSGHLFQGRYKAILVEKEAHLLELCRYVVLNPVRARMVERPENWAFSSYQATAGLTSGAPFLYVDWILNQFGRKKKRAQGIYQRFVAEGINKPAPWSQLVGQIYLGSEAFRRELKDILQDDSIGREIPLTQRNPVRPRIDELLERVAEAYEVKAEDLVTPRSRSEAREAAIYLTRQLGGHDLRAIANRFGIGHTRVSQIVGKVRKLLKSNENIEKLIKAIENG